MKCEYCNKEHNGSFATGRFCNRSCSNGFSTKAKRKEINEKGCWWIRCCCVCGGLLLVVYEKLLISE